MNAKRCFAVMLSALSLPFAVAAAAPASSAAGPPLQRPLVALHVRSTTVTSTNWAGYATAQGPFTAVSAGWTQPAVKCGSKTTYASFWVGLDGYNSNTVEQTGTLELCSGGHASYYGWVEFYPALPKYFSAVVAPGDVFTASVTESAGRFTTKLHNATEGWTGIAHKTLSAARSSAEVIAEAPSDSSGVLPLANFGTVKFTNARANGTIIGVHSPIDIVMKTSTGTLKAQPSALTNGRTFTVTWHHS